MYTELLENIICDQCHKEFDTKTGLSVHMTKKHSGKTYDLSSHKPDCTCSFCKAKRGELTGKDNPSFGKTTSEETRKKQSDARAGKSYEEIYGDEQGKVMRDVRKEHWEKQRNDSDVEARRRAGVSSGNKGKPKSVAHRQKLSDVWDEGHTAEVIQKMGKAARSKYANGYFHSVKNHKDIFFQSSYEMYAYICFEHNDGVESFDRCHFTIPYSLNGEIRRHLPDIDIHYTDGSRKVLEIKPEKFLKDPEITAKRLAGEAYCKEHGMLYEMLTEEDIQSMLDNKNGIIQ